jgi:YidC/Oxa1 family membrane protein insertase
VIGVEIWQSILNALGSVLAGLYSLIPSYGIDIIILTIAIRLLLLPLGVKQIRSMQATQALQPKLKALQQKYKNDKQRLYQETQNLYKEYGYNPLSGCLPLLLQLPVLIALFAVLRTQGGYIAQGNGGHIPKSSDPNSLYQAIVHNEPGFIKGTGFLGTNLLCSAIQSGKGQVSTIPPGSKPPAGRGEPDVPTLNCGGAFPANTPYYVLALLMVGTTYFQQRQMTRASPAGANSQQQTIMRIMPLLFGFWGFIFPAGLVVYWSTTNSIQIGQQWYLLHRKGAKYALAKPEDGGAPNAKGGKGGPKQSSSSAKPAPKESPTSPTSRSAAPTDKRPKGGVVPRRSSGNGSSGRGGGSSGGSGPNGGRPGQGRQTGGGSNAGSRKKRPKR